LPLQTTGEEERRADPPRSTVSALVDDKEEIMAPKVSPEEARQGRKTGHMRYVLGISTVAAAVILLGLFFYWS